MIKGGIAIPAAADLAELRHQMAAARTRGLLARVLAALRRQ
jgi:hypothetical protein